MSSPHNRALSPAELDAFGNELDALRARHVATLGQEDARYIRKVVKAVRYTGVAGRVLLYVAAFSPLFAAWLLWPAGIAGAVLLGLAKIMENMELGHNVIHGQYDWMGDPDLQGKTYEWDIVGTAEAWRKTHNFSHHTYTNVRGMDEDIGYGLLRIFPEQRWHPFFLTQPVVAVIFALLFQWGIAIQDLRIGRVLKGKVTLRQLWKQAKPVRRKITKQVLKDYVLFPALAGPFFLTVMLGNLVANGIRNVWTYVVIFCGHFTADAETFPKNVVVNETRGHWYLRQLRGSSNLSGGKWLHFFTGNLSHQIEHHFYPDVPSNRYAAMAVEVRQICERYGQNYNTGSMLSQFGQVVWRILRHSLPSKPKPQVALVAQPSA